MNKKLEELFNLPDDIEEDLTDEEEKEALEEVKTELAKTTEILDSLTSLEKIDTALSSVSGLDEHDSDMDDIAKKAIDSYQKMLDLGMNVSDAHAAKIFEAASTMLKTAMDAKDAKVNRKLKTIELQLKKAKLDHDSNKGKRPSEGRLGQPLDRNELLKIMKTKDTQGDKNE